MDAFGKPVSSASIEIEKSEFKAESDPSGSFRLDYAPGQFVVKVSKAGFTTGKLELNVSQKVKYPLGDVELLKVPPRGGIYFINKASGEMQALVPNATVSHRQESIGFMQWKVMYWPSQPNPPVPTFKSGTLSFVDTSGGKRVLAKLNEANGPAEGAITLANRGGPGLQILYEVNPKERSRNFGDEKVLVRTFDLGPGGYVWVSYAESMFGERLPAAQSKLYWFAVE